LWETLSPASVSVEIMFLSYVVHFLLYLYLFSSFRRLVPGIGIKAAIIQIAPVGGFCCFALILTPLTLTLTLWYVCQFEPSSVRHLPYFSPCKMTSGLASRTFLKYKTLVCGLRRTDSLKHRLGRQAWCFVGSAWISPCIVAGRRIQAGNTHRPFRLWGGASKIENHVLKRRSF
jgi:hypothetical protein